MAGVIFEYVEYALGIVCASGFDDTEYVCGGSSTSRGVLRVSCRGSRDSKWYAVSFTNALGVSIGSMILIYILREYGEASMKESYRRFSNLICGVNVRGEGRVRGCCAVLFFTDPASTACRDRCTDEQNE